MTERDPDEDSVAVYDEMNLHDILLGRPGREQSPADIHYHQRPDSDGVTSICQPGERDFILFLEWRT